MPFTIVRNDIVNMDVEAIVNSSGTRTSRVGGVEGSILDVGGRTLREEIKALGKLSVSEAKFTSAKNFLADYIIHVRGPKYKSEEDADAEILLRESYKNCLNIAMQLKVKSIAFPLISSGSYGYPKKRAMVVAQEEILRFLEMNDLMIYLVVYDKESLTISEDFQLNVIQYIGTNYVLRREHSARKMQTYDSRNRDVRSRQIQPKKTSLETSINNVKEGFTKTLLSLIDETGQKDSYIYKKANIDRKLFSKIRNNPHYRPSKNTILAFAIALELSLLKTNNLLSKAGYILSESIPFDVIISYCLKKEIYDIYEVNNILFLYDQELLGSQ